MNYPREELESHKVYAEALAAFAGSSRPDHTIQGLGKFCELYLGRKISGASTLVTGYAGGLAVSVTNHDGGTILFLNIDTMPDSPPAIVRPGFYNQDEKDQQGRFRRPIDRLYGLKRY